MLLLLHCGHYVTGPFICQVNGSMPETALSGKTSRHTLDLSSRLSSLSFSLSLSFFLFACLRFHSPIFVSSSSSSLFLSHSLSFSGLRGVKLTHTHTNSSGMAQSETLGLPARKLSLAGEWPNRASVFMHTLQLRVQFFFFFFPLRNFSSFSSSFFFFIFIFSAFFFHTACRLENIAHFPMCY